jgi:hypothetical protein
MQKLSFISFFILAVAVYGFGQTNPIWFVAQAQNDQEIQRIYDSLRQPLFIVNNNVYSIASECITRALAADANDRDLDGAANNRNNTGISNNRSNNGAANDRANAGTANDKADAIDRVTAGGVGERADGGGHNNRNNAGNANDRNNAGNANDRDNSAALLSFRCAIDKKGKLILYFKNLSSKDKVRIYYGHSFFNSKYFKIQPL